MDTPIQRWQVFHLYCDYAIPSKYKYVLIACLEPVLFGFMINSEITEFAMMRPNTKACYALIKASQHPFLKYDSYADCTTPCLYRKEALTNLVGIVSEEGQQTLINAAKGCQRLPPKYRAMMS